MKKVEYKAPECDIMEIYAEGVLAASTFGVTEYESNGNAIELEF